MDVFRNIVLPVMVLVFMPSITAFTILVIKERRLKKIIRMYD